jgi:hypothetical protein
MKQQMAPGVLLLVVIVLAGCGRSTPIRFYDLSPLAASRQESAGLAEERLGRTVVVGPVEVPTALDRPQLVRRLGANEVELLEFHQWASPLKDALPRLLVDNLAALLGSDGVQIIPWQGALTSGHHRLAVRIISLDATLGQGISLVAQWDILAGTEGESRRAVRTRIDQRAEGNDVAALVAAESEALAELSRRLAAALQDRRR